MSHLSSGAFVSGAASTELSSLVLHIEGLPEEVTYGTLAQSAKKSLTQLVSLHYALEYFDTKRNGVAHFLFRSIDAVNTAISQRIHIGEGRYDLKRGLCSWMKQSFARVLEELDQPSGVNSTEPSTSFSFSYPPRPDSSASTQFPRNDKGPKRPLKRAWDALGGRFRAKGRSASVTTTPSASDCEAPTPPHHERGESADLSQRAVVLSGANASETNLTFQLRIALGGEMGTIGSTRNVEISIQPPSPPSPTRSLAESTRTVKPLPGIKKSRAHEDTRFTNISAAPTAAPTSPLWVPIVEVNNGAGLSHGSRHPRTPDSDVVLYPSSKSTSPISSPPNPSTPLPRVSAEPSTSNPFPQDSRPGTTRASSSITELEANRSSKAQPPERQWLRNAPSFSAEITGPSESPNRQSSESTESVPRDQTANPSAPPGTAEPSSNDSYPQDDRSRALGAPPNHAELDANIPKSSSAIHPKAPDRQWLRGAPSASAKFPSPSGSASRRSGESKESRSVLRDQTAKLRTGNAALGSGSNLAPKNVGIPSRVTSPPPPKSALTRVRSPTNPSLSSLRYPPTRPRNSETRSGFGYETSDTDTSKRIVPKRPAPADHGSEAESEIPPTPRNRPLATTGANRPSSTRTRNQREMDSSVLRSSRVRRGATGSALHMERAPSTSHP
ncbi:uncharacterized protein EI90DRAFT_3132333 [Cantharellus anzutake]|uniref:uncharacterized protein n=1 Tax=Cantharellus anzutake TaxID=1750568 RepID=UPI001907A0A1|nr:uncharacterized protein EI90DRAFT_3132333 [Cantharellus anzutake]KAF8319830.1 hypothetical protein EI90DRAFT_3132333 [Cantharellus anzutake]